MKMKNLMWKNKKVRAWWISALCISAFALTATIVVETVPIISGTFNIIFGGVRPNVGKDYKLFKADYENKKDVLEAANEFNVKVCEEGITLLKNENNVLPLKKDAKVSVFGKNSTNLVYGGSGSGGGNASAKRNTFYDSLKEANITYNPVLENFYANETSNVSRPNNPAMGTILSGFSIGEVPISSYNDKIRNSYKDYNDAAVVVISRIGGEGFDLPRTMKDEKDNKVNGARNVDDHYLQLDQNETDMLKEACKNFDNVIVVLNTPTPIELGFLDDPNHYAYNEKIKGCIWMGLPGDSGALAIGRALNGMVNPSGRTTDTYVRNFKLDPSFANFGNNNVIDGNRYLLQEGSELKPKDYYYVDYEEGINIGYRYYETRAYEESKAHSDSTWYKDHVIYPFGYGLSYTKFKWTIKGNSPAALSITGKDKISMEVEVENTGTFAGKDVVELYFTAPYTKGGIEKSHIVLGDFAKTKLLKPGEKEVVKLEFDAKDMASYDYNDKNANGFKGYELEKGDYTLTLAKNVHTPVDTRKATLNEDIKYVNDEVTNYEVKNQFDDVSAGLDHVMSRSDYEGTKPTTPTTEDRTITKDFLKTLRFKKEDEGKPYFTDKMPTQSSKKLTKEEVKVTLRDLVGKKFDDPLWEQMMNQLTIEEMSILIGTGAYGTINLENIGKPITYEPDGPSGFCNFMTDAGPVYDTCFYAAECVMGHTRNKELAKEMGHMIGNESLVGDQKGTGLTYSGWYAPAVNIHRSQFAGRNWEYYSEDPYLSGAIASEVIKGCNDKGVYTFIKHFVANDQETNRDSNGCLVWLNEQALREIYLKPFEMAVKDGNTHGVMSSFNRLGTTWAGGSYPLLTTVLRDEWGFEGTVITDYALSRYMNVDQMIRAGGDLVLNQGNKAPSSDYTPTQVSLMRKSTKNILYTIANSNAMNKDIDGYRRAIWEVTLIAVNVVIYLALIIWGSIVIILGLKKDKSETNEI